MEHEMVQEMEWTSTEIVMETSALIPKKGIEKKKPVASLVRRLKRAKTSECR